MIKKIIAVGAVLAVIFFIVAAGFVAYSFLRTPEAATGPIEAIPVSGAREEVEETGANDEETAAQLDSSAEVEPPASVDTEETEAQQETEVAAESGAEAPAETAEAVADTETQTEAGAEAAAETGAAVETAGEAEAETSASPIIFEISQAESEARFLIDEVLRGEPTTVEGATNQVAAQFAVDPNSLSTTQVGIVQINARTLATDNNFRNRAIRNWILLTDQHEFVTFTPTELIGLPEMGAVGETYTFQIVGDLTVTDVTRQVTFDVTATAVSDIRVEAVATTNILYSDFELAIPDAPAVDAVADEVRLELEFVAEAL